MAKKQNKTKENFYVTTPIYYPSGKPHIGSAYTTLAADILARWHKLLGKDVFFLTGTDEHTKKVVKVAKAEGKTPKEYTDYITPIFQNAWKRLGIKYDRFIRTSDEDHKKLVEYVLDKVYKNGEIYKGHYEGLYCYECEAYYTERDAPEKNCPIHKKPLEIMKEETYFFKLSKYQKKLLELYKKNPGFISPEFRKNEIINRVKEGLRDLSISRKNEGWGVPLPFDKSHCAYVWYDALINYISGIGVLENKELFNKFWPADVHLVGKDILWFHAVIWPAILFAIDIQQPKKVFAHGWLLADKETKIGKSAGNTMDLDYLIDKHGSDSIRYFLFRNAPFGEDAEFSESVLVKRHNTELADKLGNLVSRISSLAEKYGLEESEIPKALDSSRTIEKVRKHLDNYEFDKALNEIFALIDKANEYTQTKKPWETKDNKVLWQLSNVIKDISILLSPFIPETAEKIAKTFNFELSLKSLNNPLKASKIKKSEILFKKIDYLPESQENKKVIKENFIEGIMSIINFSDWEKVELRVGRIENVEGIEGADKLYKLLIDLGSEKRTICAGLKKYYSKEELKGKKCVVLVNLSPRKMKGIESQGMLLAAVSEDESQVIIISPEKDIKEGSKIR